MLAQAERSHSRLMLDRIWCAAVRMLCALADPTQIGLLRITNLLRRAPCQFRLLQPVVAQALKIFILTHSLQNNIDASKP